MDDLTQRLRYLASGRNPASIDVVKATITEAAAALDAKDAELARLRGALGKIAKTYPADEGRLIHSVYQIAEIARAALAGKE